MDFLSSLNTEQQSAVVHTHGPLLILAGAGSGKTRVIAHRIAYLVSERIASVDGVLAVTFTNKAAAEMRTRVESLLGTNCRSMWISTFHALCARLLRREAQHIGLSRDFTIYDSADQQSVVKQLMKDYGFDESHQPRAVLSRISHAKNRMEGPDVFEKSWNPKDREIARLYAGYQAALKEASALDFDDLLLKTVELFDQVPSLRERYSRKFQFVMIDEYQDTNRPQYLLIKQLASQHKNLAVVGDPDQSIYKWRGADLRNIMDFETDFPGSQHRSARAQLSIDSSDSGCGLGGHRQQPEPEGQDALDRPEGRRQDHLLPWRLTTSRKPITSPAWHARRSATTSRTRWPCSIAPTRSRARSKTGCVRPALRMWCLAAWASTSARKSRTPSDT